MTKEEYNNLKRGDVITQNSQYFIVFDIFDNEFIDTQELNDIGVENEFGYTHTNINYKFSELVKDANVVKAIQIWLNKREEILEPYSFIEGYCKVIEE